MNDINFPAGVLAPPLYDVKMDDAPNYGNTGGTIGHELTHGFDDQGRQFDGNGNLRDWWTKEDAEKFEKRAQCIRDQYSQYTIVDDIKINGALTSGEDIADLGGLIIAWAAWQEQTKAMRLARGGWPDAAAATSSWAWPSGPAPTSAPRSCAPTPLPTRTHRPAIGSTELVVNMPGVRGGLQLQGRQEAGASAENLCKVW